MTKKYSKAWIERHTCLECGKVKETTNDAGKCYECRNKYRLGRSNWQPATSGVCLECKKDSETLYYGYCLRCRRIYGFTKKREYINKKDSKFGNNGEQNVQQE